MSLSTDRPADPPSRFSQIATRVGEEPVQMVLRYQKAIVRHLRRRFDPGTADEVASDLFEKILAGTFARWEPGPGKRFHRYLAQSVNHAADDYLRRQRRLGRLTGLNQPADAAGDAEAAEGAAGFGRELVEKVLRELARYQSARNRTPAARAGRRRNAYFTILRLKLAHPDLTDRQLAARLPAALRRRFGPRPAAFRKQLQHARELFAALLVREAAAPYGGPLAGVAVADRLVRQVRRELRGPGELPGVLRELGLWPFVECLLPRDGGGGDD
jgi:hypothetical protein